jgi:hypothetical protein
MNSCRVAKNVELRVKSWIRFQFPQKRTDQQVGGHMGIGLWGYNSYHVKLLSLP